jgi:hypothetical protein
MSFESQVKKALQDAGDYMGKVTFTWDGDDYTAVQSDNLATSDLVHGGFLLDALFQLVCVKSDFPALPKQGDLIVMNGETYRISGVQTSHGDPGLALNITGKDK